MKMDSSSSTNNKNGTISRTPILYPSSDQQHPTAEPPDTLTHEQHQRMADQPHPHPHQHHHGANISPSSPPSSSLVALMIDQNHYGNNDDDHIDDDDDDSSQSSNSSSAISSSSFSSSSSSSIMAKLPDMNLDLAWSTLSDSIFLLGGMCYLTLSIWDVLEPEIYVTWQRRLYECIENAGPVVYFINSVIDVRWALDSQRVEKRRRRQQQRQQQQLEDHSARLMDLTSLTETSLPPPARGPSSSVTNNRGSPLLLQKKKNKKNNRFRKKLKRVRKFAAHRRGLYAATAFGMAAFFGVLDELLWDSGEANYETNMIPGSDRGWLDFLAVHFYLLSAIFAVTGTRTKPRQCSILRFWNDPDMLEDLGDSLFLIGSLFDLIICDFHFDDDSETWWSAVSSILWFLDACFYLRSDYCTGMVLRDLRVHGKEHDTLLPEILLGSVTNTFTHREAGAGAAGGGGGGDAAVGGAMTSSVALESYAKMEDSSSSHQQSYTGSIV